MLDTEALKQKVVECLHTIFDPEIPVNIYELGLIYAWTLVHSGELDQAERYLQHPAQPAWEINAIRARMFSTRAR